MKFEDIVMRTNGLSQLDESAARPSGLSPSPLVRAGCRQVLLVD